MAAAISLEVRGKRYASCRRHVLPARRGRILRSILQDLNCSNYPGGGSGSGSGSTTLCSCFKALILCTLMKKLKLIPNSATDPPTRRINYSGDRLPVMRRGGLIKNQIFRDLIKEAGRPFSRLQNSIGEARVFWSRVFWWREKGVITYISYCNLRASL